MQPPGVRGLNDFHLPLTSIDILSHARAATGAPKWSPIQGLTWPNVLFRVKKGA